MKKLYLGFPLCVFALSACTHSSTGIATPTPAIPEILNTSMALEKVKSSNVPFQLYKLQATDPTNVNYSPLSLKLAFSLIYPGTSGTTEKTLDQIFGFSQNPGVPSAAEYELAETIQAKKIEASQLVIANSAWLKNPKSILPEFKTALSERHAEVHKLNAKDMNSWVEEATHHKITKLFDVIGKEVESVYVNAIYFKAPWQNPFEKKNTSFSPFQSSPHLSLRVPTMHIKERMPYYEDKFSQWVELAYKDSDFAMRIAIPKKRLDLRKIEEELSVEYMAKVADKLNNTEVVLALPKFKFGQRISLRELLTRAGYGDLFTAGSGDFKKISSHPESSISDVLQATAIEVDETGTEAAAATGIFRETGLNLNGPKIFNADQPFLFILLNKKTNEIYFLGRVTDPTKS
ncbi:MAG: serpin family protein [Bdellovibrionales bacterium]|nr:serpin family protein [Oligoflexia bacterium]